MKRLTIIAINDIYELTNYARLRTLIKSVQAARGEGANVITVLAGDFLAPSILSSMDKGLGTVECLNLLPISHVCFGNHEGDFGLPVLQKRISEFKGTWLNSNVPSFPSVLPAYDVIRVSGSSDDDDDDDDDIKIGLLGLLSDEKGMFRGDKFRGFDIGNVKATALRLQDTLRRTHGVHTIVPVTHQSFEYDVALAQVLQCPVILGGHDHEMMLETVGVTTIVKAGQDAHTAAVVDLSWESPAAPAHTHIEMVAVADFDEDQVMAELVAEHLHVVKQLDEEIVFQSSGRAPLTSRHARSQQTSIGSVIASACKSELGVDAVVINAGPIKGNKDYPEGRVSYNDLKDELPFPTKLVTVDMPGHVLQNAIAHSRRNAPEKEDRAFLQVDSQVRVGRSDGVIASVNRRYFDPMHTYSVALPRNLLAGFCDIRPLMAFAKENPHSLPNKDNFWFTLNLVLSHFSKGIWLKLGSFQHIDVDGDGLIDREEIRMAIKRSLGQEPTDIYLTNLMNALDLDMDGTISRKEFDKALGIVGDSHVSHTRLDSFSTRIL